MVPSATRRVVVCWCGAHASVRASATSTGHRVGGTDVFKARLIRRRVAAALGRERHDVGARAFLGHQPDMYRSSATGPASRPAPKGRRQEASKGAVQGRFRYCSSVSSGSQGVVPTLRTARSRFPRPRSQEVVMRHALVSLVALALLAAPSLANAFTYYAYGSFCSTCQSPTPANQFYDDGLHDDDAAGDGVFGAIITVDRPAGRYLWCAAADLYGVGSLSCAWPSCWCTAGPSYANLWTSGTGDVIHLRLG